MPRYFFTTTDNSGSWDSDPALEFQDNETALLEARKLLGEIARGGLPGPPMDIFSVEVFDGDRKPIVEFRLVMETIPK